MYNIELKNEYGSVRMGNYTNIQLTSVIGIGLPTKTATNIQFSDCPGTTQTSIKDNSRIITIAGDFYGDHNDVKKIYKILYHECTIKFILGEERRQIKGKCMNPEDFTKVGGGITSFVIQFECDFPYFEDFFSTKMAISKRENHFPNLEEDGTWYIQLSDTSVATTRNSQTNIINNGDIIIYPVLKIRNISETTAFTEEQIDIYNETINAHIKLDYNMSTGEIITVNLPEREIISSINGDITHYISDDTELSKFFLELGENYISVTSKANTSKLVCEIEYNNNYAWAVM